MGRLDIDVPLTPNVDPIGPVLVTRKWERMDDTIIVQHADLEILGQMAPSKWAAIRRNA